VRAEAAAGSAMTGACAVVGVALGMVGALGAAGCRSWAAAVLGSPMAVGLAVAGRRNCCVASRGGRRGYMRGSATRDGGKKSRRLSNDVAAVAAAASGTAS
jgi:hypothetical protein